MTLICIDLQSQIESVPLIDSEEVLKVESETDFYSKSGIDYESKIFEMDSVGRVSKIEHRNGPEIKVLKHYYNNDSQLVAKTIRYSNIKVYDSDPDSVITKYIYNSKGLIQCRESFTENDSLIVSIFHKYNAKNEITSTRYFPANQYLLEKYPTYDRDSFSYHYVRNKFFKYLLDEEGKILTRFKVSKPSSKSDNKYDKYGNFIENKLLRKEYVFDGRGNWIKCKVYNKPNDNLYCIVTRNITYKIKTDSNKW